MVRELPQHHGQLPVSTRRPITGVGWKVVLEVVFQTRGLGEREVDTDPEELLPRFKEKGRVGIARMSTEWGVDYWIGR